MAIAFLLVRYEFFCASRFAIEPFFLLLLLSVYRSYEYMLDYLRKTANVQYHGEEMTDVIRVPQDAEIVADALEKQEIESAKSGLA